METGRKIQEESIKEEKPLITYHSPSFFKNLKKKRGHLAEGFIQEGTMNMIYSAPGLFKSILALYLAICVTSGKEFLGMKTKKATVIYFDRENGDLLIKNRMTRMHKGLGLKRWGFPLFYVLKDGSFNDPQAFLDEVLAKIKETKAKLIIFDTWRRYTADAEENSSGVINKVYSEIFSPITEVGCSVLILHHSQKGNDYEYRGSSDLEAMNDTVWCVQEGRCEGEFLLKQTKNREGSMAKIGGFIDFQEDKMTIQTAEVDDLSLGKKVNKFNELGKFVLATYFPEIGSQAKKETIRAELEATQNEFYSPNVLTRLLNWWVDINRLKRVNPAKKDGMYERIK